jgi:hypothetical protein
MDELRQRIYDELGLPDWPDALDRDAAMDSVIAFHEVLGANDDVALIITSQFEDEVKARLSPAMAAVFKQERGAYGRCMAKTLTTGARPVVVVDVDLLLKGSPDAVSTFRHEGLHAVMHLRGESLTDSRETIADRDGVHPDVIGLAGIAAEEYRVERAVNPPRDELCSSFESLCGACHNVIRDAAVDYFYDHNVERMWNAVMGAFSPSTVQAAYVVAWVDADDRQPPVLADAALDKRRLGDAWREVITAIRALPPADVAADRDQLDVAVIEIAHCFDDWLAVSGFRCEHQNDGGLHFHVYEHEDWVTRELVEESSPA